MEKENIIPYILKIWRADSSYEGSQPCLSETNCTSSDLFLIKKFVLPTIFEVCWGNLLPHTPKRLAVTTVTYKINSKEKLSEFKINTYSLKMACAHTKKR